MKIKSVLNLQKDLTASRSTPPINLGDYSSTEWLIFYSGAVPSGLSKNYASIYESADAQNWNFITNSPQLKSINGQDSTLIYELKRTKPYIKIVLNPIQDTSSYNCAMIVQSSDAPSPSTKNTSLSMLYPPTAITGDTNGTGVLATSLTGNGQFFATQSIGEASEDFILVGKIQESDDNSTWSDVVSFSAVGAANALETKLFNITKAYIRYSCTLTGDPAESTVGVLLGRLNNATNVTVYSSVNSKTITADESSSLFTVTSLTPIYMAVGMIGVLTAAIVQLTFEGVTLPVISDNNTLQSTIVVPDIGTFSYTFDITGTSAKAALFALKIE